MVRRLLHPLLLCCFSVLAPSQKDRDWRVIRFGHSTNPVDGVGPPLVGHLTEDYCFPGNPLNPRLHGCFSFCSFSNCIGYWGWSGLGVNNFRESTADWPLFRPEGANGGMAHKGEPFRLRARLGTWFPCVEALPVPWGSDNSTFRLSLEACMPGRAEQMFKMEGVHRSRMCLAGHEDVCLSIPMFSLDVMFVRQSAARGNPNLFSDAVTTTDLEDDFSCGRWCHLRLWRPGLEAHLSIGNVLHWVSRGLMGLCPLAFLLSAYLNWAPLLTFCRRMITGLRARLLRGSSKNSVRDRGIHQIVVEARLSQARTGIAIGVPLLWLALWQHGSTLSDTLHFCATQAGSCSGALDSIYVSDNTTMCLVLPAFLFFFVFPQLLTARSLDALNVYLTCVGGFQIFGSRNLDREKHWIVGPRILQCILCGNEALNIGLQLIFSGTEILVNKMIGRGIAAEVGLMTFMLGIVLYQGRLAKHAAEAVHDARRLSHSEGLVTKLLESAHDVVLHLDAEMNITRPSPRLASLALCTSPGHSMFQGACLLDICCEEDRERVAESFQQNEAKHEGVAVNAMTLRLRDAFGNYFSVEVSWAYLPGEFECFLVGIRDESENRAKPVANFAAQPKLNAGEQDGDDQSQSSEEVASSGATPPSRVSIDSCEFQDHKAYVLMSLDKFVVLTCSAKIDVFFGSGMAWKMDFRRQCLDPHKFEAWFRQQALNASDENENILGRFAAPFVVDGHKRARHGRRKDQLKLDSSSRFYELVVDVMSAGLKMKEHRQCVLLSFVSFRLLCFHDCLGDSEAGGGIGRDGGDGRGEGTSGSASLTLPPTSQADV